MTAEFNSFDVILGASREHILAYFGRPDNHCASVMTFKKAVGTLVIIVGTQVIGGRDMERVSGFALYGAEGKLLHANGIQPLTPEKVHEAEGLTSSDDIRSRIGEPHFDLGSGIANYGYLTDCGELFVIGPVTGNARIEKIKI